MSYSPPNKRPYFSDAWSSITAAGMPRAKYPLPQEAAIQLSAYAYDQAFEMAFASFNPFPVAKNTPSSTFCADCTDANAILTSYSSPTDQGAGLASFDATFHRVPASWSNFSQIPFTFPGFRGVTGRNGTREIFTDAVSCRVLYEYFVIDADNIISGCSDGVPANSASVLDSANAAVKCVYKLGDIAIKNQSKFFTTNSGTPDFSSRTNSLVKSGGESLAGVLWYQTLPKKETYQTWITNASTNGWASAVWDGTSDTGGTYGQLIAEDSRIEPYAGNIVQRITIHILAK